MNWVNIADPARHWDEPVPLQTLKSIEESPSRISTPPPIHTPETLSRKNTSIYPLSRESSLPALGTSALLTTRKPDRYKFRLGSAFMSFFVCGWADGTPGTIIPHLEQSFHLSHLRVSSIFICGTIGFAIGTVVVEPFMIALGRFTLSSETRRFVPPIAAFIPTRFRASAASSGHSLSQGRMMTLLFGCVSQLIFYIIAVTNPPFWALCIGFCFGGIAVSIFSGQMNAYVASASVRTQGRALGNLHGFYGIGAFASPLVCQTLLAAGWPWYRFYFTSLGLSFLNAGIMIAAFHTTRGEFQMEREEALQALEGRDGNGSPTPDAESVMPKSTMSAALKIPYVWLFMVFLLFYTGSETTTGGWIVTYLLRQRAANANTVGYVASGFWGGLAVGRIGLGHLSPYIGMRREKHLVHVYIALSVVMTLIIWLVPSFVGDAFAAALIGLFLGPIFPTSLSLATKMLPKEVHLTALAAMSSLGSVGTALFPFIAGVLASAKGVVSLQPFMCGILGVMGTLWCFFPSRVGMSS